MSLVLRDLLAGSVAGTVTILVMTPLDTARTRLQVSDEQYKSGWQVLSAIRREEGFRALYKGMLAPLCAQAVYKMVMFSSFGLTSRALEKYHLSVTSFPVGFCCGAFAGGINSLVVTPVELIRNKLAVQKGFTNLRYSGPLAVLRDVYSNYGIRGMFRGLGSTLVRDIPGVGAYFGTFHFVRGKLLPLKDASVLPDFALVPLSGACAGISFWTIALPTDAIKTLVQTTNLTWREAFRQISWWRVYKTGYTMALARGIPGSSITFSVQTFASNMIDRYLLSERQMA